MALSNPKLRFLLHPINLPSWWASLLHDSHRHSAIDHKVFLGNEVVLDDAHDQLRHVFRISFESVQSFGLHSSLGMKWTIKLVFEAVPGSSVEHELGIIEQAEEISPANVGLTIAEGKALLARLQEQVVTAQVQ